MQTKLCPACSQPKAHNLFGIRRASRDGLSSQCRECLAEKAQVRYWVNPEVREKSISKSVTRKQERFAEDPAYKRAFQAWNHARRKGKRPAVPWTKIMDFVPICKKVIGKGPLYCLDHIIPLRGKMVSGLHVPSNLRVVLKSTNHKKSNHFKTDWE